jgi:hypothetical protein
MGWNVRALTLMVRTARRIDEPEKQSLEQLVGGTGSEAHRQNDSLDLIALMTGVRAATTPYQAATAVSHNVMAVIGVIGRLRRSTWKSFRSR